MFKFVCLNTKVHNFKLALLCKNTIFSFFYFFRLKLLEKKKTEMALKSRKEIADYIAAGKPERAKIRVEHIIREDYYVEAMEIVEMYCDLLLARFGLIEQMKNLDDGLAESISSLIWVAPRLLGKIIFDIFGTLRNKSLGNESPLGI